MERLATGDNDTSPCEGPAFPMSTVRAGSVTMMSQPAPARLLPPLAADRVAANVSAHTPAQRRVRSALPITFVMQGDRHGSRSGEQHVGSQSKRFRLDTHSDCTETCRKLRRERYSCQSPTHTTSHLMTQNITQNCHLLSDGSAIRMGVRAEWFHPQRLSRCSAQTDARQGVNT